MRQRGATSNTARITTKLRRISTLALTGLLVLAMLPLPTLAAPPAPDESAVDSDSATKDETDRESPTETALAGQVKQRSPERAPISGIVSGWGSVRRRGLEAPVQLRRPEPKPAAPEVEEGDGVPPRPVSRAAKKPDEQAKKDESAQQNVRVWPMRAKSYTFTQAFGCVPQIANFYFAGEGCPADAPVVHSGVDLAAPEGTPFYAAAAGWVTDTGYDREVGVPNTRIIIQHVGRNEGFATEYLHWIASYVDVGDYVEAGEMIGEVGSVGYSTGPHLHFSVVDLESGEHIDPIGWLPKSAGNEGYRGVQPNAKAAMRLPAGTTAGLPEMADPSPPPPPERQDVPDSPRGGKHKGKGNGKHKRDRRDERAAKRDAASADPSDQAADSGARNGAAEDSSDTEKAKGKRKDRTHKRERDKDGKTREDAASGDNGDATNADDGSDKSRSHDKSKHDNRGSRRGNGNGNGHDSGNHDRDQSDKDKRDNRGGSGGKNDKGSGQSGGAKGSPDDGRKPGGQKDGAPDQTDPGDDGSAGQGDEGDQPLDDGSTEDGETDKSTDEAPARDVKESSESGTDARAPQAADNGETAGREAKSHREQDVATAESR